MPVMRRTFTYLLAATLFAFCVFSEEIIPQNMSYELLSSVKRNALKDKKELLADMKAIVQGGFIKIELYSTSGELVGTVETLEDFTNDLELKFTSENLSIKTITNLQNVAALQTLTLP